MQFGTHLPFEQESLLAHTIPQPPQLRGSVFSYTQTPLQSVNPGTHTRVHVAAEQNAGGGQTTPHPPQSAGSE
jgi:hypothetical protein